MTGRWLLPSWTWMTTVVELDRLTALPWSLASTNTVNISATLREGKGIDSKLFVSSFLIVPFRYKCVFCNGTSKVMWCYAKCLCNWVILLAGRLTGVWLICPADMPFSSGHMCSLTIGVIWKHPVRRCSKQADCMSSLHIQQHVILFSCLMIQTAFKRDRSWLVDKEFGVWMVWKHGFNFIVEHWVGCPSHVSVIGQNCQEMRACWKMMKFFYK